MEGSFCYVSSNSNQCEDMLQQQRSRPLFGDDSAPVPAHFVLALWPTPRCASKIQAQVCVSSNLTANRVCRPEQLHSLRGHGEDDGRLALVEHATVHEGGG